MLLHTCLLCKGCIDVDEPGCCLLASLSHETHHLLRVPLEVLILQENTHATKYHSRKGECKLP